MFGIDISNYQNGIDLSLGEYDFAFIKATEGTTLTDRCFHKFAVNLIELNKLIGCYHFSRPKLNNTLEKMRAEADHFISAMEKEDLIGRAIMALDWETEPIARQDLLWAWLERVEKITGIKPIVYANSSHMGIITQYACMDYRGKWLAQWPTIKTIPVGQLPYGAVMPVKYNPVIWQYSSNGSYPGLVGRIDLDYTKMTRKEWLNCAGASRSEEGVSGDFQWAIDCGIIKGYTDGSYKPNELVTRNQMATIIRRAFDYTIGYISNNIE